MKAPRTAHWLLVPTLALGIAAAPVRAQAAVGPAPGEAEKGAKDGAAAPKGGEAAPKTGSTAPKTGSGAAPKTGSAPEGGEAAPKSKVSKLPKGTAAAPPAAGGAPGAEAGTEPVEGASGAAPEAGTTPEGGAPAAEGEPTEGQPPTEGEPTEAAPAEAAPIEPEITVQPRPVEPSLETTPRSGSVASREVVADPRRLRADDRILFRAGVLSLGIAAAAVVPTVIGFQQAYVAHEDDDPARERTMRGLGIGAGIAAGTYAITGIVLVSLGARQRRAAVAPAVGPGQVGAVFRARF